MLSGKRDSVQHPVRKSPGYDGGVDMKKCIFFVLLLGIAVFGFVFVIWYACAVWKGIAVYDILENSKVIALVKRNIFAADCSCLTFQKGTLYHGQDTFEVLKFDINQSDLSWNVVSNRLASLGGGLSSVVVSYDLPLILRNLAGKKEQMIGEFVLDQTSVYVTFNKESSLWHMYLVGNVIPVEQIDEIIR